MAKHCAAFLCRYLTFKNRIIMKTKIFTLFAAMLLLFSANTFAQSETTLDGDVNKDGVVDVADIAAVIAIMAQIEGEAAGVKYYWYVGTENPASIGAVANSTTDKWTELGTSLSGIIKIQAESPATKYGYWFVVIPSTLGFKPFNSNGSTDESGGWTSSTSTISGYTVWSKNDKTTKINQQFHK
jgi:hypothetical protein